MAVIAEPKDRQFHSVLQVMLIGGSTGFVVLGLIGVFFSIPIIGSAIGLFVGTVIAALVMNDSKNWSTIN